MKKLQYGMVGGGQGAFIGNIHRKAIAYDNNAKIVSGCFSTNYENTLMTGAELEIDKTRLYKNYKEMAEKEKGKLDFVVIVTPNNSHYEISKCFLEHKINVVCDKPLTFEIEEAEDLKKIAEKNDLLFCVTYTFTGQPAVKQARAIVQKNEIGKVRVINAEYPMEWLYKDNDSKQASWRMNPSISGKSNCVGDIGTHIQSLIYYITDLRIERLCARLDKIVESHVIDDNASILLDYKGGAKGMYWCSQVVPGYNNGLRFRIFGDKGSVQWYQEDPNYLVVCKDDEPMKVLVRGRDKFYPEAERYLHLAAGHPEGFFDAFINVFRAYTNAVMKKKAREKLTEEDLDFPNLDMGIDGVRFINRCVESSDKDSAWIYF